MNNLTIIDNFLDDREFRNFMASLLEKTGYRKVSIDDTCLNNGDDVDDNDLKAEINGILYTVQTFLNTEITDAQIEETLEDMRKENIPYAIIITNTECKEEIKRAALLKNITVLDREFLKQNL